MRMTVNHWINTVYGLCEINGKLDTREEIAEWLYNNSDEISFPMQYHEAWNLLEQFFFVE